MLHDEDGWITEYQRVGALWIHDDDPKRPHALLTSGKHSNGFFNSELVIEDPILLEHAVNDLLGHLHSRPYFGLVSVDRVIGPAMGAITLAHEMARQIARWRSHPCLRAYTEKEVGEGEEDKRMVFKKTAIRKGEVILAVDDVYTTGGSVGLMTKAVVDAGGDMLPLIVVLVNRSGKTEVDGVKIISLVNRPMPIWEPEECPLCKVGSEAIRPKSKENWARLNASH